MAEETPNVTTTPADRPDQAWWVARHQQALRRVAAGDVRLVLLGDSITQGWEGAGKAVWARYYAHRQPLNLGYSGDKVENALWRVDHGEVDGIAPKAVVIMLGTNNTGHRMDPAEDVAAGMRALLHRLRTRLPGAKILLLGIFPRAAGPDEAARVRNREINALYEKMADGEHILYADIGHAFLEADGTLPKAVMPDLLHLNADGYRRWAEAMEPLLAPLLGEDPIAPAQAASPAP